MIIFDTIILTLICASVVIATVIALITRAIFHKLYQQSQNSAELKQQLEAMLLCETGKGERIKHLEKQLRILNERQDKFEISDGNNTSYKQAMVLLQKGIDSSELVDACDLSRGELDLLSTLESASNRQLTGRTS
ncbi:MAG: DUF2802 domain-containing protein [Gammaproteobacteria bacterium]|nr:DUF2802 domain-containing protein [Gammaproteobacteria bacterium]